MNSFAAKRVSFLILSFFCFRNGTRFGTLGGIGLGGVNNIGLGIGGKIGDCVIGLGGESGDVIFVIGEMGDLPNADGDGLGLGDRPDFTAGDGLGDGDLADNLALGLVRFFIEADIEADDEVGETLPLGDMRYGDFDNALDPDLKTILPEDSDRADNADADNGFGVTA